jgi:hypothetical protein
MPRLVSASATEVPISPVPITTAVRMAGYVLIWDASTTAQHHRRPHVQAGVAAADRLGAQSDPIGGAAALSP